MFDKIKSNYIFKEMIKFIPKRKYLKIFIKNKKLQKKLNISIDTYIDYYNQIEIEIIPYMNRTGEFDYINKLININKERDESLYHIYLNENNEEIKRNYIYSNDEISKIKVIIDSEEKSLKEFFKKCHYIKEIKFIKFNRTDFTDYSSMFSCCEKLTNLDISKLKTDNVETMRHMFACCRNLKI